MGLRNSPQIQDQLKALRRGNSGTVQGFGVNGLGFGVKRVGWFIGIRGGGGGGGKEFSAQPPGSWFCQDGPSGGWPFPFPK